MSAENMAVDTRESIVAGLVGMVDAIARQEGFSSLKFTTTPDGKGGRIVNLVIDETESNHHVGAEYLDLGVKLGEQLAFGGPEAIGAEIVERLEELVQAGEFKDHGKAN